MGNESKKMRRSAQTTENIKNEAEGELKAKNNQSNDKVTTIATLDNGTMIETFKYLNYCGLAKNSLVSKRFCSLILTHRHSLALLYVNTISMDSFQFVQAAIRVFGKKFSSEAYNEWVMRNNYSKQIPTENQVVSEESTQSNTNSYLFAAYAYYTDSNHRDWNDTTRVFLARVELQHENWPIFQHFVRLITDPFIYIDRVHLAYQNDVMNSLAGAIISDHDRLHCKELNFDLRGNIQKSITWIKNHVRCNKFSIIGKVDLNQDEALLDFFVTGASCTQLIYTRYREHSKVVTDFVRKFVDLKNSCESHLVEAIEGEIRTPTKELFKRYYAEFIVTEERIEDKRSTAQVFEFINYNIGKKLQLTAEICESSISYFSIKINNL